MAEKILLVEDEEKMARMLELELQHEGYTVEKAFDGLTGLERAEKGGPDLVLHFQNRKTPFWPWAPWPGCR